MIQTTGEFFLTPADKVEPGTKPLSPQFFIFRRYDLFR
jgi:hypothetical protein